jgi:hypothetical protein
MEIQFYGANCVRLGNKKVSVIVDDNLTQLGLKSVSNPEDIAIFTLEKETNNKHRFLIDGPGEYEISEVSVRGIPARAHLDESGLRSTIYSIQILGFSVGIIGHVHPDLTDEQIEKIGLLDVLIVPVGGNGYTLDAVGAASLVKKIEPKVVIPTHFADSAINYEVPQSDVSAFLSEVGSPEPEKMSILKLKESDLNEKTRVVLLERS